MPKATRAKDSNETPKKRSRKTQPADGNGMEAAEPVTTAPAIAQTTPEVVAQQQQESLKKPSPKASPFTATTVEPAQTVVAETVTRKSEVVAAEPIAPKETLPAIKSNGNGHINGNGHVSEELVRRRAYELYLQRRGQGGSAEQDWFQALQEIRGRHVA